MQTGVTTCLNCGGAIFPPNMVIGYAGPVCWCPKHPDKIYQRPANETFHLFPQQIIGIDKNQYDKLKDELTAANAKINELEAKLEKAKQSLRVFAIDENVGVHSFARQVLAEIEGNE